MTDALFRVAAGVVFVVASPSVLFGVLSTASSKMHRRGVGSGGVLFVLAALMSLAMISSSLPSTARSILSRNSQEIKTFPESSAAKVIIF